MKAESKLMAQTDTLIAGLGRALDLAESLLKENRFLREQLTRAPLRAVVPVSPPPSPVRPNVASPSIGTQSTRPQFYLGFKDKSYVVGSARGVMTELFRLLAAADGGFLDRFAAEKHGRKRRYLARDRQELYPDRPHLCDRESVEVVPGWWLGTNYSCDRIQKIIDLAIEVAGPQLGSTISANVR